MTSNFTALSLELKFAGVARVSSECTFIWEDPAISQCLISSQLCTKSLTHLEAKFLVVSIKIQHLLWTQVTNTKLLARTMNGWFGVDGIHFHEKKWNAPWAPPRKVIIMPPISLEEEVLFCRLLLLEEVLGCRLLLLEEEEEVLCFWFPLWFGFFSPLPNPIVEFRWRKEVERLID